MARRVWWSAVAALIGVSLVGTAAYYWNPPLPSPAADGAASSLSRAELERAGTARAFLGHMSVGWNILSGVAAIYAARELPEPRVVQLALGQAPPQLEAGAGAILHAEIGVNGDPLGKLANFNTEIRGGMAETVNIAILKFCFTDFTNETDSDELFAQYVKTLDALQRDYPSVRFIHATVPLEVAPRGIKGLLKTWLGRDRNVVRERYNELVRRHYSVDEIFDVARVESIAPDGTTGVALYAPYSSDGAHLNATGSGVLASALIRILAA